MAKKQRAKNKATKIEVAYFGPGQHIGGFDMHTVIADVNGKLWHVDNSTGHARPVTFGK
jgi:hypothetical protein